MGVISTAAQKKPKPKPSAAFTAGLKKAQATPRPSNTNLGKQLNAGAAAAASRKQAQMNASEAATRKTEANARAASKRTSAAYRGGPMQPVDQNKMRVKPTVKKATALKPRTPSNMVGPKKKLGGKAKTISRAAYKRQMAMYRKGTRKRPPQKRITGAPRPRE